METLDHARNFWQNTNQESNPLPVGKEDMKHVVKLRFKKEQKQAAQYFWLSFFFHIVVYSFASHLIIRYWGDPEMQLLGGIGALLYIPCTVILMRKFKAFLNPSSRKTLNIQDSIGNQYKHLAEFYRFKKRFDLASSPLNAIILTAILFKLYVPGGFKTNLTVAAAVCFGWFVLYSVAARRENKKHFIMPLQRLGLILDDMQKTD